MMNKLMKADEAVRLVQDGDTISVCGISGGLTPEKLLAALGKRFSETGSPKNLTIVFPVAVGDGYEIKGLDHLAQEGMIRRLIGGSYTVARSSEPPPRIYEMIINNKVEAYNFPMGVLMHLHREIAAKRPGLVTEVGLGTFVDPRVEGGRMNEITRIDLVEIIEIHSRKFLFFPSFPINCAFIRGTTADEDGNITMEHEYSLSTGLALAMAAHNSGGKVIAQVKRVCAKGTLNPQLVRVPGIVVDAIVVDEQQKQTTEIDYDAAASGEIRVPWDQIKVGPMSDVEKIIGRRALLELKKGNVVNLGFGLPSQIPHIAWEEGVFDKLVFTTEHGCIGGFPYSGIQFGGAINPWALLESPSQFDFIDGGGPDVVCLAFAEVDEKGNVNVTKLKNFPHVLAGAGGFIDLVQNARKIIFCGTLTAGGLEIVVSHGRVDIRREGKHQKFVKRVQQITFNAEQKKMGQVVYITERAVFNLKPEGIILNEIAPGVNIKEQLEKRIGFNLKIAPDLKEMPAFLFRPDPMGIREFDQWR